ncbi:pilus assembly protein N-terminal domain-containing protein [Paraburkholderia phymatum]|uniref:Type II and III secretion system protein n=1 Tax=Paraburkholderia phymatum (strain DSM 17167 / CIP 108236 / LMG 21445 / STM815) TaxID=391038 RepID=B2JN06_PARP8|nr:type II and III secretion system protein family protein [Paraburkholderia phymatum]ACC74399.1 type II and III secretion system protein [Paraburkholderia phymatum STM815]
MNARDSQRAQASCGRDTKQAARPTRIGTQAAPFAHRAHLIQASVCALMGACLWAMPAAQAASQEAAGQAPLPMTMASNGGAVHLTIGMSGAAPAAAAGVAQGVKGPNCTGAIADHQTVTIPIGKSTMVNVRESVKTRTVGNPSIVQAMLVSPQTLYLLGTDVGTTNMIVQGRSGSCTVIDVAVGADPGGLQQTLAVLMPEESGVQVKAAADTLVLTGTVSDSVKAERIVELARAYVARQAAPVPVAAPANAGGAQGGAMIPAVLKPAGASGNGNNERIVNMMHVAAPQQVMLEVKVAEVSKTLIDQLGMAANIQGGTGSWSFGLLADFLSGGMGALLGSKANNKPLNFAIDAQKTDQLVKVLAEPTLMAISGQEASFLAGGRVFIPVPQSNGAAGSTIILQEETFGVGLTFTPTVLDNGRINLKVSPEVSELSPTGVAVTAGTVSTTAVLPLITTRRASTTLQVYDGQSFAIGGLMKSNVTGTLKGLPGLGEVPVLGALFRSTNFQEDKTELVFVVTPRLAKPLPQNYPLPTDHFGKVTEAGVFFTGNMEGKKPQAPAEAVPPSTGAAVPANAIPSPMPVRGGPIATTGSAAPVVLTPVITSQGTTAPTPLPAPERTQPVSDAIRAPATPRAPDNGNGNVGDGSSPITRVEPPDVHTAAVPTASVTAQPLPAVATTAAATPAAQPATQQAHESGDSARTQ